MTAFAGVFVEAVAFKVFMADHKAARGLVGALPIALMYVVELLPVCLWHVGTPDRGWAAS